MPREAIFLREPTTGRTRVEKERVHIAAESENFIWTKCCPATYVLKYPQVWCSRGTAAPRKIEVVFAIDSKVLNGKRVPAYKSSERIAVPTCPINAIVRKRDTDSAL